jgi:hypothetical protein
MGKKEKNEKNLGPCISLAPDTLPRGQFHSSISAPVTVHFVFVFKTILLLLLYIHYFSAYELLLLLFTLRYVQRFYCPAIRARTTRRMSERHRRRAPIGACIDPVALRVGILAAGGQESIVEEAVGLVRLVEGVIDHSVGDSAQAPPAGPSKFARIVRHIISGRLVVPALALQPIDDRRAAAGQVVQRFLIQTVGKTPHWRPDEHSKFTDGIVPLLLLLCLLLLITVLIRRKRQNTTDILSTTLHHNIQLTGGFLMCQSRMVNDTVPKFQSREEEKKSNRSVRMSGGRTTATETNKKQKQPKQTL